MLSRFISKPSRSRLLNHLITSTSQSQSQSHSQPYLLSSPQTHNFTPPLLHLSRYFSSNHNNNNNNNNNNKDQSSSNNWKLSQENDGKSEPLFGEDDTGNGNHLTGITDFDTGELKSEEEGSYNEVWTKDGGEDGGDVFEGIDKESGEVKSGGGGDDDDWLTAESWSLTEKEKEDDVFDIGVEGQEVGDGKDESGEEIQRKEEMVRLEKEEQEFAAVLKGPNRAFGDLIAASGITVEMLDSLIALKDFEGVEGLPPLTEIEDMRYEKSTQKSSRADIERQKQEEIAKARVRQVDDNGRAYGTGRRKCSIARVWVEPGEGKFIVNDKEIDVYFPMLDHRAALLRPFSETKTLGLWDVKCTVKGGGISGQVGAVRLGISRALQNWEPGLRPALRDAGFLTRDSRVVERKKPGRAKARKSFQWVKR